MKKVAAVVLRAPLALVLIALVRALLEAAGNVPRYGASAAFSIRALLAHSVAALPWALSLGAWYLAIVAGRRFRSRLAAHTLVFACTAICALAGLLAPISRKIEATPIEASPVIGHFFILDGREIAIASLNGLEARGVIVEDSQTVPRLRFVERATWVPESGLIRTKGEEIKTISPRDAEPEQALAPPFLEAGGTLEWWLSSPRDPLSLAIAAFSFALLAAGVRFPVRLFPWPLPGALLGLLYAWAMPGLYAIFGSPTTDEVFRLAGLQVGSGLRAAILATAFGLFLLLADLTFRAPDMQEGTFHA